MEKRQNPTYLKYVDAILSEFPSKEPGHGCFLLRQIIGKRGKKYTQEQIQTITVVLCNLVENNYLVSDDNSLHGFIKLSDALVDYQYGAAIAVNRIDLASYIDGSPGRAQSFEVIWRIIGVENEAPFYVPGWTVCCYILLSSSSVVCSILLNANHFLPRSFNVGLI